MISVVSKESELEELSEVLLNFYAMMPYTKKDDAVELRINWESKWKKLIDAGAGAILALKKSGKIIGGIGMMFFPALEDDVVTCGEAFWYVDEKERGGGLKLLLKAQKYAKEMGARRMTMIHLSNSMPNRLKGLYERLGFKEIETHYMKEI